MWKKMSLLIDIIIWNLTLKKKINKENSCKKGGIFIY